MNLIKNYKEAEKHYENWRKAIKLARQYENAYKQIISRLKSPLKLSYKQYSQKARQEARKQYGTQKGKQLDHKWLPVKLAWLLGVPIEELNDEENIEFITAKQNRLKSFKVIDWQLITKKYAKYIAKTY